MPFAGSYRLIDFALSNFANAGLLKMVVLTQYKSHSLDRHVSQTWRFSTLLGHYVTPVPAQMRRGPFWFSGSADAIYQNLNLISDESPDLVCVFGADHIYRMDPQQMIDHHVEVGAGVTVAAIPVPKHEAREFGVIESDVDGRILDFHEKVEEPPTMPGDDERCLASMGNYVFDTQTLIDVVTPRESTYTDLGGHVIPALTKQGVAHVYDFSRNIVPGQDDRERGYWRDVGTIDSYYIANMDLIAPLPAFNLYNDEWPVYTYHGADPPAKVSRGPGLGAGVRRRLPAVPGVDRLGRPRRAFDHRPRLLRLQRRPRHRQHPVPRRARRRRRPPAPLHHRQERRGARLVPHRPRARQGPRAVHRQRQRHRRHRKGPQAVARPIRVFAAIRVPHGACPGTKHSDRAWLLSGQRGDDRGERLDFAGADDHVAEAELLAAAHQRLGDLVDGADEGERTGGDQSPGRPSPSRPSCR